MKKVISSILVVAVLVIGGFAYAADFMSKTGTGTTAAAVVFPAVSGKAPVVASAVATSDLASSLLDIYEADNTTTTVDATSALSQAVLNVTATTGFDADDYVVIQKSNGTVSYAQVTSIQSGVSLTMYSNLTVAGAAGDKVYEMKKVASIKVAAATISHLSAGMPIAAGSDSSPLLALLDGTSACTINALTVQYVK